jgi:hypothetical protein
LRAILTLCSFFLIVAAHAETPERGAELVFGCQGEGCGCSGQKITNKAFRLYEEMSVSSKLLGDYKKPVKAGHGDSFSRILAPGNYRIVEVIKPTAGLKAGDIIDSVFSHGEGWLQARFNGRKIGFEEGVDLKLEAIERTKVETWYVISVGDRIGYSQTFPFRGCRE